VKSPPTARRIVSNQACSVPAAGARYPAANTRVLPILLTMRSATLQILPLNSAGQGSRPPFVTHGRITKEPVYLSVCLSVVSVNFRLLKTQVQNSTVALQWHWLYSGTGFTVALCQNIIKIGMCLILRLSVACVSGQCIRLVCQPNAQNQTHTSGKDTIASCVGTNIPPAGSTVSQG